MSASNQERQAALRSRRQAADMVRVEMWIPKSARERVVLLVNLAVAALEGESRNDLSTEDREALIERICRQTLSKSLS